MSRITLFLPLLLILGCTENQAAVRPITVLQHAPLYTFNERELDAFLRSGFASNDTIAQRVVKMGRKAIGQPYKLFVLGEFPFELIDPDPLFCLAASDCVTFVEQSYALALANNWSSFFKSLQHIRYKDGVIGFESRNHFTEADWNVNNEWLFEEVTDRLAPGAAVPMRTRIDRAAFFGKVHIARNDPVQILESKFIPTAQVDRILPSLHDGDIVEFVRAGGEWKSITHMGLIAHNSAGLVTLLHSGKPAVHELPLVAYLTKQPAFVGVRILRALDHIRLR